MAKNKYDNYSKEQLIDKIKQFEKQQYGLVWEDKPEEIANKCERELPVLSEDKSKEIIKDTTKPTNFILEGDNYHTLYTLSFTHKKKIDVIYIDPPYNTGKENEWRYNDKWVDNNDKFRHSNWLSFINKRLQLAKPLLKDTGIIFISIDDNEIAQLKMLCDKIFLEKNLLNVLVWDLSTGTQAGHFVRSHEYILAYARNKNMLPNFQGESGIIDHSSLKKKSYKNPESEFTIPLGTRFDAPDGFELKECWGNAEKTYLIKGNFIAKDKKLTQEVVLKAGWSQKNQMLSWFSGEETFDSKGQKIVEFYFNSSGVLHCIKDKSVINPASVLKELGSTKNGSTELESVIGQQNTFNFPKSLELIKFLIKLKPKDSIILDFFAGSGTTGQAVLELNNDDNGTRQFILCTNNENKICEDVTYPRVSNVINGYADKLPLVSNLKYYRTDFVPYVITDNDKRKLVSKSTELLCITENTFEIVKQNSKRLDFAIFKNTRQYTAIIYDEDGIESCCSELNKINPEHKVIIYVFSYDHTYDEIDFETLKIIFDIKPIPEIILNVYRKNFKLKRK